MKISSKTSESPAVLPQTSESYVFIFKTVYSDILIKENLFFPKGFDEMILDYMTNLENICITSLRLERCSWRPTSILVF